MKSEAGFIYILTNPSFPDFVKIGYATDVAKRLQQLNRSECIPFAFRVYAIYETSQPLQDKQLHKMIDTLNPELRAIETFSGKTRTKEFYAIAPEDAYALLECIASISGTSDKLKKFIPEGHEVQDEELAKEIREERRDAFNFRKCGIPIGAILLFKDRPSITAIVKDERKIDFQGKETTLSRSAQEILNRKYSVQGTVYWTYNGRLLNDIRAEKESQKATYSEN